MLGRRPLFLYGVRTKIPPQTHRVAAAISLRNLFVAFLPLHPLGQAWKELDRLHYRHEAHRKEISGMIRTFPDTTKRDRGRGGRGPFWGFSGPLRGA